MIKTYKINVHRMDKDKKMSNNNRISKLSISGHKLNFSNSVFEYLDYELIKNNRLLGEAIGGYFLLLRLLYVSITKIKPIMPTKTSVY